jgi:hypothetical protein
MKIKEQVETQAEAALTRLRNEFDERLSVLQVRSAADRLRSTVRGKVALRGKVKAGSNPTIRAAGPESSAPAASASLPTRSVRPVTGKSVVATYSQAQLKPNK